MYSLRRRLLVSATLLLLFFLGFMGLVLNRSFEQSVLSNAEDALRNQILLLIANIDVVDGDIIVPEQLPEPRLSQVDSNLFAQIIVNKNGVSRIVWTSSSLLDKSLPILASSLGEFSFFHKGVSKSKQGQNTPDLYVTTLGVEWESIKGYFPFTVQVAEQSTLYQRRLARYQQQVGLSLLVLGGVLIALLLVLLGWALKPLNRVAKQVGQIEQGQRQRFDEDYPLEVNRLTQNLNQLLAVEELRITRQKEVLGNLAHSLKTPIAVLSGLKFTNEIDTEARQQLATIQTIIDYQLQSASAIGRRRFIKPIKVKALTVRIINSLYKVHSEKDLQCELNINDDVLFFGDEGDWMELVGNLIDNAFKWGRSAVFVQVSNISLENINSQRQGIQIIVEDDGPGINQALRDTILDRGVRLDSQTPGHGLGLHIVKGIVEAYQGRMTLGAPEQNSATGVRFQVELM